MILNALVKELEKQSKDEESELKTALEEALHALLESISDAEGLNTLMLLLLDWSVVFHYDICTNNTDLEYQGKTRLCRSPSQCLQYFGILL